MDHDSLEGDPFQNSPFRGRVVPFARRWHVIQEIDLIRLVGSQRGRLALCELAEHIADDLPQQREPETTTFLAALDGLVMGGGADEDACLAAMLLGGPDDPLAQTLLDHIRTRHVAEVAAARELIAALTEADAAPSPETLGHMLRGFFTACRHAVDFEQLTIIALAGHRLTPDARAVLADALAESAAA